MTTISENNFAPAFSLLAQKEVERIYQWFYKTPMLISSERYAELRMAQRLIHKAILYFVSHYSEYETLLPLTEKAKTIVEICSGYPYRVGTYRPDFLISEDNQIKICEINARFPLNGYFFSGFSEIIANQLAVEHGINQPQCETSRFFDYLDRYFGGIRQVCALKSPGDRTMDLRYYSQIFENSNIPCDTFTPDNISEKIGMLSDAAVVNEFNQMDLETLDLKIIEKIASSNSLNDMRSIFLIHDKRFMSILANQTFLSKFLTDAEIEFLSQHIIPTYTRAQRSDLWDDARKNKNQWILKPYLLGKSQNLFAGCVTEPSHWQNVFESGMLEHDILQPFVQQKRFIATLDNRMYQDYVVGTLLCFDDQFFGPGIFRTSSFPVTNLGDDRKVAPFVTDTIDRFETTFTL